MQQQEFGFSGELPGESGGAVLHVGWEGKGEASETTVTDNIDGVFRKDSVFRTFERVADRGISSCPTFHVVCSTALIGVSVTVCFHLIPGLRDVKRLVDSIGRKVLFFLYRWGMGDPDSTPGLRFRRHCQRNTFRYDLFALLRREISGAEKGQHTDTRSPAARAAGAAVKQAEKSTLTVEEDFWNPRRKFLFDVVDGEAAEILRNKAIPGRYVVEG